MRISVPYTQQIEIEIGEREEKSIFMAYLHKLYNWRESYYIDNGEVVSSNYGTRKFIRIATEEDVNTENLINKITDKMMER